MAEVILPETDCPDCGALTEAVVLWYDDDGKPERIRITCGVCEASYEMIRKWQKDLGRYEWEFEDLPAKKSIAEESDEATLEALAESGAGMAGNISLDRNIGK
jgi:transcription elongation factor Elf1